MTNVGYLVVLLTVIPLPHYSNGYILDTAMVWALPRSLAATKGIVFTFSSSDYLDVSVHPVPASALALQASRFSHSEI